MKSFWHIWSLCMLSMLCFFALMQIAGAIQNYKKQPRILTSEDTEKATIENINIITKIIQGDSVVTVNLNKK